MKKYYPSIQILRGMLFLVILAFHCGAPFASLGWGGVEAFFVISAFFLVKKYWGTDNLSIKNQFVHRIARLYPPYVTVLIVAALYVILTKTIPFDIIVHLLSGQNFHWMITGYKSAMQPLTAHTWTLSIEVWSGLVWLFLLNYLNHKQFKYCMYGMIAIGILYRTLTIILGCDKYVVSLCPLAHFDAFACGSLLAIGCRCEKINRKIGIMCVLGVVGIVTIIYDIAYYNNITFLNGYLLLSSSKNYLNNWFTGNIYLFLSLTITGLVGLLYLHDSKNEREHLSISRIFVTMGDNSYVLYLFHWPILMVIMTLIEQWFITFPLTLIASIVATYIFNNIHKRIQKNTEG